jgi:succinyl-diaminopimelate desuccinylase
MDIKAKESEVVSLLQSLIRTKSINPPGSELEIAKVLFDWFQTYEIQAVVHPFNEKRANLIAHVSAHSSKKSKLPALAFCGHLDTVPLGDSRWTHDPLSAEISEGRVYGRGAADMKGGLAAMAAALVFLNRRKIKLNRDIYFICTAGEEVDSIGASMLVSSGIFEDIGALIIGEPTGLDIAISHKGALWVHVRVPGRMAHGSTPQLGSNAIVNAGRFIEKLVSYQFNIDKHPLLGNPTVNPGLINGGISVNVVPDSCEVTFDIRTTPGMTHKSVLEDIRTLLIETLNSEEFRDIEIKVVLDRSALSTDINSSFVRMASEVYERISKRPSMLKGMSYYTDASVIVPATGIPTILLGPGEIDQAHKVDEYVKIEYVLRAMKFYEELAVQFDRISD